MKRFTVLLAPRVAADVEQHVNRLERLEKTGAITEGYAETRYDAFEATILRLSILAARHPFAPERKAWNRDVRNAFFEDYRVLYLIVPDDVVWVMRVRHQRQAQLKRPGPGTRMP